MAAREWIPRPAHKILRIDRDLSWVHLKVCPWSSLWEWGKANRTLIPHSKNREGVRRLRLLMSSSQVNQHPVFSRTFPRGLPGTPSLISCLLLRDVLTVEKQGKVNQGRGDPSEKGDKT